MTVRHLRIFTEVCRTENITRASESLHMTQPAVTRAVHEIEAHYGAQLFERIGRRIYVTDAGRLLYARALHILESFDMLENELRDGDSLGRFRIGAGAALGNTLMPQLCRSIGELYPRIRVQVTVTNGENLRAMLLGNRLDMAFLEGASAEPELVSHTVGSSRLCLIMPPSHPLAKKGSITLSDVARCELLLRERGSGVRSLVESSFDRAGIAVDPLWESGSTAALIGAVAAGIGLSILPKMLVGRAIERGEVVERSIEGEGFSRDIEAVWHKSKLVTPVMLAAVDYGRRRFGKSDE